MIAHADQSVTDALVRARAANDRVGVPLSIGPVDLETNLLLAPIAGYCDLAFRIVTRKCGSLGLACTDLLSPHGLLRGNEQSMDLARTSIDDQPICMQLYGGDGDILADGARWAVDHGAKVVDINMGCPVDKVTKKDGGSMLLCDPPRTLRIFEQVARAVESASRGRVPLTAKVRLGWHEGCWVAPYMARQLERAGAALVTVHGRTTEQRFRGSVHLDGIAEVVASVESIPVIGNGDVKQPIDALAMMERTGCAGVMIGRGALSAPWIFDQAWAMQTTGAVIPDPDEKTKLDIMREYFDRMVEYRTVRYALANMRSRVSWFGKRLGPCKPLKEAIRVSKTPGDVHRALDEFEAGGLRTWQQVEDHQRAHVNAPSLAT
ncbi:MAG: tRNA-dihydrouridine synthase [Planctomycetota bacterium]